MRPDAKGRMSPDIPIPGEETSRRIKHGSYAVHEFDDGEDDCVGWICAHLSGFSYASGFRGALMGFYGGFYQGVPYEKPARWVRG